MDSNVIILFRKKYNPTITTRGILALWFLGQVKFFYMIYFMSNSKNTSSLLTYEHDKSEDYRQFFAGNALYGSNGLHFAVSKESAIKQLHKHHIVTSTGPILYSNQLRDVLLRIAPTEVEFFDAEIHFRDQRIEGFSVINPLFRLRCVDLEKSECQQTNFDTNNPKYSFDYEVLLDEMPEGAHLAICHEHHRQVVVSQVIKEACRAARLKGLQFCRSLDMTPADRSECEMI